MTDDELIETLLTNHAWSALLSRLEEESHLVGWAGKYGESIVCRIARYSDARELLTELLKRGADPNRASDAGLSPLGAAINGRHSRDESALDNARNLIAAGADVNAVAENEFPALHWAVEQGKPQFVRLLLSSGADPSVVGPYGQDAIDIAREHDATEIIELLQSQPNK